MCIEIVFSTALLLTGWNFLKAWTWYPTVKKNLAILEGEESPLFTHWREGGKKKRRVGTLKETCQSPPSSLTLFKRSGEEGGGKPPKTLPRNLCTPPPPPPISAERDGRGSNLGAKIFLFFQESDLNWLIFVEAPIRGWGNSRKRPSSNGLFLPHSVQIET